MKKILLILFMLPSLASASEYEGYQIQKELGPYEGENIINDEYPHVDYEDYIYSEYSAWTSEKKDLDFIEKTVYKYSSPFDTNKIVLSDFQHPYYYVDIKSIKVFYNDEEIPYSLSCTLCEKDFDEKLKNNLARIDSNGTITLNLNDYYESEKLNVFVDYISPNEWTTWIGVKYFDDELIVLKNNMVLLYGVVGDATLKVIGNKLDVVNRDKIIYKDDYIENEFYLGEDKLYAYREKLYRKYKENKILYPVEIKEEIIEKENENIKQVEILNEVKLTGNEIKTVNEENDSDLSNVSDEPIKEIAPLKYDSSKDNTVSLNENYLYVFYAFLFLVILGIFLYLIKYLKKENFEIALKK